MDEDTPNQYNHNNFNRHNLINPFKQPPPQQTNQKTGFNGFDPNGRTFCDVVTTSNINNSNNTNNTQHNSYGPNRQRNTRKRPLETEEPYNINEIRYYSKFDNHELPNQKRLRMNIPTYKQGNYTDYDNSYNNFNQNNTNNGHYGYNNTQNNQYNQNYNQNNSNSNYNNAHINPPNNGTNLNNTQTTYAKQTTHNNNKRQHRGKQKGKSTKSRNSTVNTVAPVNFQHIHNNEHEHKCHNNCNHSNNNAPDIMDQDHIDATQSYKQETRLTEHTLDMKKLWYDRATDSWFNADDPFYEIKRLLNKWGNAVVTQKKIKPHIIIPNITKPIDESPADWAIKWGKFINHYDSNIENSIFSKLTPDDIEYKYYSKPRNDQDDTKNPTENTESATSDSEEDNDITTTENNQDISDSDEIDDVDRINDIDTEMTNDKSQIDTEEQNILERIKLFKPNDRLRFSEQKLINPAGEIVDYKLNPIRSTPCMIIVLNPNGQFVKNNQSWQSDISKEWNSEIFPWYKDLNEPNNNNQQISNQPWFQLYDEHHELQIDLPKALYPDKSLKRDVYRLFKYDKYYKKYATNIRAIKRWRNELSRRVSVYVSGDKPIINQFNAPNKIGPNKWASMNIQTPNSALTWAQKKAQAFPMCGICGNLFHTTPQCYKYKKQKTEYIKTLNNQLKNGSITKQQLMQNIKKFRYRGVFCKNCGSPNHKQNQCKNPSHCVNCKSHNHSSQREFNCPTLQHATHAVIRFHDMWETILNNNNKPIPPKPIPTSNIIINKPWFENEYYTKEFVHQYGEPPPLPDHIKPNIPTNILIRQPIRKDIENNIQPSMPNKSNNNSNINTQEPQKPKKSAKNTNITKNTNTDKKTNNNTNITNNKNNNTSNTQPKQKQETISNSLQIMSKNESNTSIKSNNEHLNHIETNISKSGINITNPNILNNPSNRGITESLEPNISNKSNDL